MPNYEQLRNGQLSQIALYRNEDDSLRTGIFTTFIDPSAVEALLDLSNEMKVWDSNAVEKLCTNARAIDNELFVRNPEAPVIAVLNKYMQDTSYVLDRIEMKTPVSFYQSSAHSWWNWEYRNSISQIHNNSRLIENCSIDKVTVQEAADKLDECGAEALRSKYQESIALKELLSKALHEYESKFEKYVACAEKILPGIFSRKDFCRSFQGAYDKGELDYFIFSGNQTIVEHIEEYIHAFQLEQAYSQFEEINNGMLLSNRFLGRHEYGFEMDSASNLSMFINTNFGYGRSSYFNATLNYRGVSAIDAYAIIFYRVANFAEVSGSTYEYEVGPNSFSVCFEQIRDLHNEFIEIGEARFVEKYFKQSLEKLAELLFIVANSNTFLQITTLDMLNRLVNKPISHLIPTSDFKNVDFELSQAELTIIAELCSLVHPYMENGEELKRGQDKAVDILLNELDASSAHGSLLNKIVKQGLIRNELVSALSNMDKRSGYVVKIVNTLLPQNTDASAETYEGYELIDFRVKTVSRVLSIMDRLQKIANLIDFNSILKKLHLTCSQVCGQAKTYRCEEIIPRLRELAPVKSGLEKQLDNALERKAELEKAKENIDEINECIKLLRAKLTPVANEISMLESRDVKLKTFIENVESTIAKPTVALRANRNEPLPLEVF